MAVVKITIYVPEIETVIGLFDVIEVQRSKSGTPYADAEFITTEAAEAPVLSGTGVAPFADLQARDLHLRIDGVTEQTVGFTAANPISMFNAITEFNNHIDGAVLSDDGLDHPVMTGETTGTGGILEVLSGTAMSVLGFEPAKANGTDAQIPLLAGVDTYIYEDRSGEASYWYRERYLNTDTGVFGPWGMWEQGSIGTAIPTSDLIVGTISLADVDGTALVGARILIVNVFSPYTKAGFFIAGRSKELETDSTGQAESSFIRGSTVDIVIEGTSLIRRITVPSDGTSFDIMDEDLVQDDPFQIQVPDLPAAPRSS